MKKFFTIFFVTLGVIFSLILLCIAYLFIFDPFNIKPLLSDQKTEISSNTKSDNNPILSDSQEKTLEKIGIDPASIPSSFSQKQIECFETKLGGARVIEIMNGASPTIPEMLSAQACL